jgi:hypothetical protein
MTRPTAALLGLLLVALPARVRAESTLPESTAFHAGDPLPVPDAARSNGDTQAVPPEREFLRHPFELRLGSGLSLSPVQQSPELCAAAAYRLTPSFALGLDLRTAVASLPGVSASHSAQRGVLVQVLAQVFVEESGRFDPYVFAGLGYGAVSRETSDGFAVTHEQRRSLAASVGGGVEWFVTRNIKLGPRLELGHGVLTANERCGLGSCLDLGSNGELPASWISLSLLATWALGESS